MSELPIACTPHDHDHCVSRALLGAESICMQRGVRLTALRRRVLELVWQSHKPMGAYDILSVLSDQDGRKAAPPTVYRALDFLLENGLIHRIASLNAFMGCTHPGHPHQGQFLICQQCHMAIEMEDPQIREAIAQAAGVMGFRVAGETVEIRGLCKACQELQHYG